MIFNLLLQHGWLDYNHLYVFGKSLHQQEYKVLRKRFEAGLSKQQISNVFNSLEALGNIPPLIAIEKYSACNRKIRAAFYDDWQNIPDPSALDPTQKNLLILDDCFLGKQNKAEAYYTRGRHNCNMIYIAQNYFRLPRQTIRENSNFFILFPQDTKNLTHIHTDHCASDISPLEFKQFCHGLWSKEHNFVTIDLVSTPTNGKYCQNFIRFYFPTGTILNSMEAYRAVIMEAFRDRFVAAELLSYKEVLFEEAAEEWYALRDTV